MVQIALAALLVWSLFRLIEKDGPVDGFTAAAFVVAPAIFNLIVSAVALALEGPIWIGLPLNLTYLFFPYFMLKQISEYSTRKVALLSFGVLSIVVVSQIVMSLIFGQIT